jgi:DNA mismatch repair protein MutH
MVVSINGGQWRYPKMDGFIRDNPIKMDHLGVPNLWKPSNVEEAKMKMLMESDGNFQCLICNHVKAKI